MAKQIALNVLLRAKGSVVLESELKRRVIGQDAAVDKIVQTFERQMAGLHRPRRPLGSMLFLGPTGCGKSKLAEALAETLFGNPDALLKIDCAELQESQSTLKLIGSAPGYIGYSEKEEQMYISQAKLDAHQTEKWPINIMLLDEIEKAHDNLFRLFLGILDKGTLSLNNGKKVDFTKTIVLMTSNLGAEDVSKYIDGKIGFSPIDRSSDINVKLSLTNKALKRKFSPEFLNRIDQTVHFNHLESRHIDIILELECRAIQKRILTSDTIHPFSFTLDDEAKKYILSKGTSKEYGARELNRVLDQEIVTGLSSLILTGQIEVGDEVFISYKGTDLQFGKIPCEVNHEDLSGFSISI
jgi:ATP-dependent Clp protease ATP-binding subunit ClpB